MSSRIHTRSFSSKRCVHAREMCMTYCSRHSHIFDRTFSRIAMRGRVNDIHAALCIFVEMRFQQQTSLTLINSKITEISSVERTLKSRLTVSRFSLHNTPRLANSKFASVLVAEVAYGYSFFNAYFLFLTDGFNCIIPIYLSERKFAST